ncbi:hypothetical protein C8R44DRAFT_599144, partial [Mycena epipterygia]
MILTLDSLGRDLKRNHQNLRKNEINSFCFSYTVDPECKLREENSVCQRSTYFINDFNQPLQDSVKIEKFDIRNNEWLNLEEDDEYIFSPTERQGKDGREFHSFTMYKRVDKKIRPVSTTFSPEYEVTRRIPQDPLATLPELPVHPPEFKPTKRLDAERLKILEINKDGFLSKEEEKLFVHVMELNQEALAFEDAERGTFKDEYFSPYKIATVPHTPWEYKNIPIPPGILKKV